jgi:hypothetical protein
MPFDLRSIIFGLLIGLFIGAGLSVYFYICGWKRGVTAVVKNPHNFTKKGRQELVDLVEKL